MTTSEITKKEPETIRAFSKRRRGPIGPTIESLMQNFCIVLSPEHGIRVACPSHAPLP
ncbi:MAG TPA: hypothetical protein VMW63_07635 [Methanoregulaceae archaeon]|nr:hypothetical protein [Methanoregulaceae archaeon]